MSMVATLSSKENLNCK